MMMVLVPMGMREAKMGAVAVAVAVVADVVGERATPLPPQTALAIHGPLKDHAPPHHAGRNAAVPEDGQGVPRHHPPPLLAASVSSVAA